MDGLTVYVKEELYFTSELSLETSEDSYQCYRLDSFSVSLFSPSVILFFVHTFWFLVVFHLAQTRFSQSISSCNVFVIADFYVHYKDCLTDSDVTKRSYSDCQLSYLDPWLSCSLSCCFGYIFSSDLSIWTAVAFPSLRNFYHVPISVFIELSLNSKSRGWSTLLHSF